MTNALLKTEIEKMATISRENQKLRIASLNRIKNLKNHPVAHTCIAHTL